MLFSISTVRVDEAAKAKVGSELLLAGDFKRLVVAGERVLLVDSEESLISFDTQFAKVNWRKKVSKQVNLSINDLKVRASEILVASNNGVYILDLQGNVVRHWYRRAEQYDNGERQ